MRQSSKLLLLPLFFSGCMSVSVTTNEGNEGLACDKDQIVFYSVRSGSGDLYFTDPKGSAIRPVIQNDSTDGAPRFNTFDGELIFRSNRENAPYLYSLSFETGSESWKMLNPAGDEVPDWSPVADQIVFSRSDGPQLYHLVVRDLRTEADDTLLTAQSDFYPSWSPDGEQIVFEYTTEESNSNIATIHKDGSGFRNLTNNQKLQGHPAWSPDGKRVLYFLYENGQADLYSIGIEGSDILRLTQSPTNELIGRYSPDGNQIVYGGIADDDWEIFIMNADGSDPRRLTTSPGFDGDPIWFNCPQTFSP